MTTVTFRCDPATEALLDSLAQDGETRSDTIRRALQDAARLRTRDRMRREAVAVAADSADLAEMHAVRTTVDAIRAW